MQDYQKKNYILPRQAFLRSAKYHLSIWKIWLIFVCWIETNFFTFENSRNQNFTAKVWLKNNKFDFQVFLSVLIKDNVPLHRFYFKIYLQENDKFHFYTNIFIEIFIIKNILRSFCKILKCEFLNDKIKFKI